MSSKRKLDRKSLVRGLFWSYFSHLSLVVDCFLTLSLKRDMRAVSEECGLQPVTIAMAYVYFEKLVLQGRLNKPNRKLVSAVCVLLAAKISSDLKKLEVKQLIDVSGIRPDQNVQTGWILVDC